LIGCHAKGVALRILNMNLDTNDATGKLMLQIIGSIAEFERSIMLSRQLEGIAKARAEGKYRGGIPTARAKAEQVFALVDAGKTRGETAEALGISIRREGGSRHSRVSRHMQERALNVAP
jgi:DNA invertase Pin-like site-specific DNA recombinase